MDKPAVFLSHSSKDKPMVKKIADILLLNDLNVWFDEWEIRGGESITQAIEKGIGDCDIFVAALSPDFVNSKWCREELSAGLIRLIEENARLIPILIEECDIPLLLRDKLYRDLRDNKEIDLLIHDIIGKTLRPIVRDANYVESSDCYNVAQFIASLPSDSAILDWEKMRKETKLKTDRIEKALSLLQDHGMVSISVRKSCAANGPDTISRTTAFHKFIEGKIIIGA